MDRAGLSDDSRECGPIDWTLLEHTKDVRPERRVARREQHRDAEDSPGEIRGEYGGRRFDASDIEVFVGQHESQPERMAICSHRVLQRGGRTRGGRAEHARQLEERCDLVGELRDGGLDVDMKPPRGRELRQMAAAAALKRGDDPLAVLPVDRTLRRRAAALAELTAA